ncbi:NYN domain-containing protein [Actinomadura sp. ATCC 31491]|uniref:NYN domain-containing protein n=1 Tax=Actinomadura luzonensis TaxID=2805427 RepID=A0ABT0FQC6_9ACTN|nr:NYN domain-containing protein [Actinomadura luzonensis]MCK2214506.1 NYN domain-containing protein [Actinomadura luzonensis]
MDRCALFVDAGYLLADGAMAVHGTRHREAVAWDYPGLLQLMTQLSRERTGLPLLRCYWYEATVEGRRTPEHDALADIPGLKLRLSRIRPGRREGVDAQVHRDLMTLARNTAICDAVVVSGDEDLAQVVCDAQDLGIRVTVIHIAAEGGWAVSRSLRQECDDLVELGAVHLRPYVAMVSGMVEPSSNGHHHQPMSNGQTTHSLPPAQPSSLPPPSLPPSSPLPSSSLPSSSLPSSSLPSSGSHAAGSSGSTGQHSANGSGSSGRGQSSSSTPPVLPTYSNYQIEQPPSAAPVTGPIPAQPAERPQPAPQPPSQPQSPSTGQFASPSSSGTYQPSQLGPYTGPQAAPVVPAAATAGATTLADAVKAAHREGHDFGESVARDAPALWLEAVLARKPRMPSDLEARLLQGSSLPIDFLLHDEVRHALRRGFWDALERARH